MRSIITLFALMGIVMQLSAQQQIKVQDVVIIPIEKRPPVNAKHLGSIKILDGGFKINCGYERTMDQAREKASKLGGNIVKITELKKPDLWSTCYRLWADVYYSSNTSAASTASSNKEIDSILNAMLPSSSSYALLCIYGPSGIGPLVQYNLHANDSMVCRVKNKGAYMVKLPPGKTTLWARTENRTELNLDVQPGKVYFLRCGVNMGVMVGRPNLELVDDYNGVHEFTSMNESSKDTKGDDIYK